MVRDYSVMIVPSAHTPGFHVHLVPWMSRGPVPAKHFQSREEVINVMDELRIMPDVQAKILKSIDRGETYHIPRIEVPDELASPFGWNFN